MKTPQTALLLFLLIFGSPALSLAQTTQVINLTGKSIPKKSLINLRVVDLQNATVQSSKSFRNKKRISVTCLTDYCMAAILASVVTTHGKNHRSVEFYGFSKAFGVRMPSAARQTVKISSRRMNNPTVQTARRAALTSSGGELRIAVPPDAFTVSGPGAKDIVARGASAMTMTPLSHAPCYDKPGKFYIVESDPRMLQAIERELELVRQGFVDPSNAPTNTAQPANAFVTGNIVAAGSSFTVSLQLTGLDGVQIAASTRNARTYSAAIDAAALGLVSQLCVDATLSIAQASCPATDCRCCSEDKPGCYGKEYTQRFSGEVSLPVNGQISLNMSTALSGMISCPGYTSEDCGPIVCCRRTSSDQPKTINWSGEQRFPPVCVCPAGAVPISVNLVAIASDGSGKSEEKRVDGLVCAP